MKLKNIISDENLLPGGKGDKTDISNIDKNQLIVGIYVELEHTNDKNIAKEVAIDHLTENPEYYSKLVDAGLVDEKEALSVYNKLFNIVNEEKMEKNKKQLQALLVKTKKVQKILESQLNEEDDLKKTYEKLLSEYTKKHKFTLESARDLLELVKNASPQKVGTKYRGSIKQKDIDKMQLLLKTLSELGDDLDSNLMQLDTAISEK